MASKDMNDIAEMFRRMKFRRKLIGGVDEQDVWRQLDAVQRAYRSAYEAQAVRYETLLAEHGIRIPGQSGR